MRETRPSGSEGGGPNPIGSSYPYLDLAEAKLAKSPLYVADQKHLVFICNERWRQRLFFTYEYGVGGVNYYPINQYLPA
ncbi:MAG: hypothetical protein J2P21_33615 [Chloracidobacterium sp.]|nr:hypothetical protein [Chloracidobacterium sp.]